MIGCMTNSQLTIYPCGLIAQGIKHCTGIARSWARVAFKPEFYSGYCKDHNFTHLKCYQQLILLDTSIQLTLECIGCRQLSQTSGSLGTSMIHCTCSQRNVCLAIKPLTTDRTVDSCRQLSQKFPHTGKRLKT